MYDLTLLTDEFLVTNSSGVQMSVDALRVSLYDGMSAKRVYDQDGQPAGYRIAPGRAHFLLAPSAAGVHSQLIATNSTGLTLRAHKAGWQLSAFELRYVDDNGATWIVGLDASRWE